MIGIFDSGVGGLSVFREIRKLLPEEKYIYFSDNAHCPYGEKSKDYIIDPAPAVAKHLYEVMNEQNIIKRDGYSLILHASGDSSILTQMARQI